MLVIDKPPVAGSPPILPPYLRPKEHPERKTIIIPDLCRLGSAQLLKDYKNNWQTEIHIWMIRVQGEGMFDAGARWEMAHTQSRRYRQWLETYKTSNGVPPHINFGGAIEAGEGDPTFYPRWVEWATETFF